MRVYFLQSSVSLKKNKVKDRKVKIKILAVSQVNKLSRKLPIDMRINSSITNRIDGT